MRKKKQLSHGSQSVFSEGDRRGDKLKVTGPVRIEPGL